MGKTERNDTYMSMGVPERPKRSWTVILTWIFW